MHGAAVYPDRRARLQSLRCYAEGVDTLGEMERSGFGAASARHHLAPNVHQSVEERAGGYDHRRSVEFAAPDGFNSSHS